MFRKFLIFSVFYFFSYSIKRYSVSGYMRSISKPSIYKWNEKIRAIIPDDPSYELIRHYTDCGGKVTKGPGTIEQFFVSRNPMKNVHCVWKIHAPENHHVYVKLLRITRTTLQNRDGTKFNDAPFVQIFDGIDATKDNRLFSFGDASLNRCLSSGQDMTIDLRYDELEKHIDHEAVIKYGFIEHSQAIDLLP